MRLIEALAANEVLWESLRRLPTLDLPDWYLGAGCVAQTVWNLAHGKPLNEDILDYDLVYFDPDLSEEAEARVARRAQDLLADLPVMVDAKNQARVHLWYPRRFGYAIEPYRSTEDAIATWPSTASAIGVRTGGTEVRVCAPFGTVDLFGLVVRANRVQITPETYAAKVARWAHRWPLLVVLPWEQGIGVEGLRLAPTKDGRQG
jgi:hypothetical protein